MDKQEMQRLCETETLYSRTSTGGIHLNRVLLELLSENAALTAKLESEKIAHSGSKAWIGTLTNKVEEVTAERARLTAKLWYYEDMLCLAGAPLHALKNGDSVASVSTERVADVLRERDRLKGLLIEAHRMSCMPNICMLSDGPEHNEAFAATPKGRDQ